MNSEWVICESSTQLAEQAATRVIDLAEQAIRRRGAFTMALAGGQTPRPFHRLLVTVPWRDALPWDDMHVFWGDERCVPPFHPDSNFGAAWHDFLTHVPIPSDNVHRIAGEKEPAVAAAEYEHLLRDFFRPAPVQLDAIFLGIGEDGHIASLFPGSPAVAEKERLVVATHRPLDATCRITLTLPAINAARHVIILVAGPHKATIVEKMAMNPLADPLYLPAAGVQPHSGLLTWLLDTEAAAKLLPTARNKGAV